MPNEEVLRSFDGIIFKVAVDQTENGRFLKQFCDAVESFDCSRIEEELNRVLRNASSIRDTATKAVKENYYHGIMNAALLYRHDWERSSNPETISWLTTKTIPGESCVS